MVRALLVGLVVLAESCIIVLDQNASVNSSNLRSIINTNTSCPTSNLTALSITNINLGFLFSNTFSGLSVLANLTIRNCSLATLPAGLFTSLSALTYLSLANNLLSVLAINTFSNMSPTRPLTIDFSNNQLTSLTSGLFASLGTLSSASFNNNALSRLEAGAFSGPALTSLELNNNNFSSFGTTAFQGLTALTRLTLGNNVITTLQDNLLADPNLSYFDIQNNNLVTLPSGLFGEHDFPAMLLMGKPPGCTPLLPPSCMICVGYGALDGCYYIPSPPTPPTTGTPTSAPTTPFPTTVSPTPPTTSAPTTRMPTRTPTLTPTTSAPTLTPTTREPTETPTTHTPTTGTPSRHPTTKMPITAQPTFVSGQHSSSPPAGSDVAVYVVVPVLICLALLLALWWCRRRKHQKKANFVADVARAKGENGAAPAEVNVPMQPEPVGRVSARPAVSTMVEIPPEEVDIGPLLGFGAFGSVSQCLWRGTDYAMKRLLNPAQHALFAKEVEVNRELACHPHIHVTRMVGVIDNPAAIVMELYPMGNVEDYLKSHLLEDDMFSQLLTMLITASAGVMHLHSLRIIHRDVAARNFLVKSDLSASICDFGLALPLPDDASWGQRSAEERMHDILPVNISAPETLIEGIFSPASDVYMFGFFIWEVLSRQVPHGELFTNPERDVRGFLRAVVQGGLRPPLPEQWPSALRMLLAQCWHRNPNHRPTMAQVNESLRHLRKEILEKKLPLPRLRAPSALEAAVGVDAYYCPVPRELQAGEAHVYAQMDHGLDPDASVAVSRGNMAAQGGGRGEVQGGGRADVVAQGGRGFNLYDYGPADDMPI